MSENTVATYKYFHVNLVEKKRKTNVYDVLTNKTIIESGVLPRHILLGKITWSPDWRQYVFRFLGLEGYDVDMSRSCMRDVITFIQKLMDERKGVSKQKND